VFVDAGAGPRRGQGVLDQARRHPAGHPHLQSGAVGVGGQLDRDVRLPEQQPGQAGPVQAQQGPPQHLTAGRVHRSGWADQQQPRPVTPPPGIGHPAHRHHHARCGGHHGGGEHRRRDQ
jgi:hypothetical protein